MATRHQGQSASKVPVSQHPVFPAIVALWFAALLGIGSLLLPVTLFERAVDASGLAAAVPAVQPPLGVTARILIALVATGLGVVAGLLIARQVARAQAAPRVVAEDAPRRFDDARSPRPILAHEELGAEGFDEPVEEIRAAPIPGRRRALSLTDESEPSLLLDSAPLPGEETEIVFEAPEADVAPVADGTLDLEAFADFGPAAEDDKPGETEIGEDLTFDPSRPFDAPEIEAADEMTAPQETQADSEPAEAEAAPSVTPAVDVEGRPLGELSISELVERFALSLQRSNERAEAAAAESDEAPASRYVPDLGVEAIEAPRFAAPSGVSQPEPRPAPAFAAAPTELPAALRPVAFDEAAIEDIEGGDEHDDLSLDLSRASEARPFDSPGVDDAAKEDDVHEYSSLLDMRRSIGEVRETIRIEDDEPAAGDMPVEPIVVFPGQDVHRAAADGEQDAPSDVRPFAPPAEVANDKPAPSQAGAERALRDALQKLQRLSGAA